MANRVYYKSSAAEAGLSIPATGVLSKPIIPAKATSTSVVIPILNPTGTYYTNDLSIPTVNSLSKPLVPPRPISPSAVIVVKTVPIVVNTPIAQNTTIINETITTSEQYTSSIETTVTPGTSKVVDVSDVSKYRMVKYYYSITDSDNQGFETGEISIVHNGQGTSISSESSPIGTPCNISFHSLINGGQIQLIATADTSNFTRTIKLFKIVL